MSAPDPTTLGVLLTSVSGLATAIGVLWKTVQSHFKTIETKLNDCESDRERLWEKIASLAGDSVEKLKNDKPDDSSKP